MTESEKIFLEYMRLDDQLKEYNIKYDKAFDEYNKIKNPAYEKYLEIERNAFLEYENTIKESLKKYEDAKNQLKEFKKYRTTIRTKYLNSRKQKISKLRVLRK